MTSGEAFAEKPAEKSALKTASGLNKTVERFLDFPYNVIAGGIFRWFAGRWTSKYAFIVLELPLKKSTGKVPTRDEQMFARSESSEKSERRSTKSA